MHARVSQPRAHVVLFKSHPSLSSSRSARPYAICAMDIEKRLAGHRDAKNAVAMLYKCPQCDAVNSSSNKMLPGLGSHPVGTTSMLYPN